MVRLNTCFDSSEGATFRLQAVCAMGTRAPRSVWSKGTGLGSLIHRLAPLFTLFHSYSTTYVMQGVATALIELSLTHNNRGQQDEIRSEFGRVSGSSNLPQIRENGPGSPFVPLALPHSSSFRYSWLDKRLGHGPGVLRSAKAQSA